MDKSIWLIAGIVSLALACGGDNGGAMPADTTDAGTPDGAALDEGVTEPTPEVPELITPTGVFVDMDPAEDRVEVTIEASPGEVTLADGLTVPMISYNGVFPGPTLEANVGDTVVAHFTNNLDEPTTIHWHGLRIPDEMDGNPRIQDPVQPGETFTYEFVVPEASTFWYHPHIRANEQVEKGLYGGIVIHDPDLDPSYDSERMIVLDDILMDTEAGEILPFLAFHPEMVHGRNGNMLLTNGRVSDDAKGTAEKGDVERWRLVNTANARTMELSVEGATFRVIGTDGGLLRSPYTTDRITLPVGQRFDLEVTYDTPGQARLVSHVLTRNDAGDVVEVGFPVYDVTVADSARMPREVPWPTMPPRETRLADMEASIELSGMVDEDGQLHWMINGQSHWEEPLFTFQRNQTVRMTIVNADGPEHPFHLHGQFFEIADRTQPGLKDTVLVPGFQQVQIVAFMDNPGQWMAHCHILEHAELGMMAEIIVEE